MILVLILILGLLAGTQGGCPVRCHCTENSINCVSKNLEYVPYFESLTNNPVIIDLSGNSISIIDIDDFSFDKSDQVKEIYLNSSELTSIEERAFEELEILQELYLNDNFLSNLPEDFITNNENMILLDLSNNYFVDMPKIKSESLEVLTIANSAISQIPNDALEGLPNLRILLLQQNNLKSINTVIFDNMSNLFFVRIAYNPWFCNCKTIKLFDYLTAKRFIDLTETVQCQREDNFFVDIYSDKGVAPAFQQQCNYDSKDTDETWKNVISLKTVKEEDGSERVISKPPNENNFIQEIDIDELYFDKFYYTLILCFAIGLSLILGAVCGTCLTFKFMSHNVKQTESTKELVSKSEEQELIFSFS